MPCVLFSASGIKSLRNWVSAQWLSAFFKAISLILSSLVQTHISIHNSNLKQSLPKEMYHCSCLYYQENDEHTDGMYLIKAIWEALRNGLDAIWLQNRNTTVGKIIESETIKLEGTYKYHWVQLIDPLLMIANSKNFFFLSELRLFSASFSLSCLLHYLIYPAFLSASC